MPQSSGHTYRFNLDVAPADSDIDNRVYQYSFIDLVRQRADDNPTEDSKLQELALSFEKKYGPQVYIKKSGAEHKKRIRVNDYIDRGQGYDSDDSFIDDAEADDIVVPPNRQTALDGFYVHQGRLEIKNELDISLEIPESLKPTNSEELSSEDDDEEVNNRRKRKLFHDRPSTIGKKSKLSPSRELVSKAVKRLNNKKHAKTKTVVGNHSTSTNVVQSLTTSSTSIGATIDSVIALTTTPLKTNNDSSNKLPAQQTSSTTSAPTVSPTKASLPSNLPESVLSKINTLRTMSKSQMKTSQFFSSSVLSLLMALDDECKSKIPEFSTRNAVFSHLLTFLPVSSKQYLMRKISKARETHSENRIRPLLTELSKLIASKMPQFQDKFDHDFVLYTKKLNEYGQEAAKLQEILNTLPVDHPNPPKPPAKPTVPRKTFIWCMQSKKIFESIVKLKLVSMNSQKLKFEERESHLKEFLLKQVVCLWPKDWMSVIKLMSIAKPLCHDGAKIMRKPAVSANNTSSSSNQLLPSAFVTSSSKPSTAATNPSLSPTKSSIDLNKPSNLPQKSGPQIVVPSSSKTVSPTCLANSSTNKSPQKHPFVSQPISSMSPPKAKPVSKTFNSSNSITIPQIVSSSSISPSKVKQVSPTSIPSSHCKPVNELHSSKLFNYSSTSKSSNYASTTNVSKSSQGSSMAAALHISPTKSNSFVNNPAQYISTHLHPAKSVSTLVSKDSQIKNSAHITSPSKLASTSQFVDFTSPLANLYSPSSQAQLPLKLDSSLVQSSQTGMSMHSPTGVKLLPSTGGTLPSMANFITSTSHVQQQQHQQPQLTHLLTNISPTQHQQINHMQQQQPTYQHLIMSPTAIQQQQLYLQQQWLQQPQQLQQRNTTVPNNLNNNNLVIPTSQWTNQSQQHPGRYM